MVSSFSRRLGLAVLTVLVVCCCCAKGAGSFVTPSTTPQHQQQRNRRGFVIGNKKKDPTATITKTVKTPQWSPPDSSNPTPVETTALHLTTADYSGAARILFSNLINPAAMISGAIVPLGFLGPPMPMDKPWKKKLDCLFSILTVVSLANELLAIMFATNASNMLLRVKSQPTVSVFALIKRDYELAWIATNVHFMLGLVGFVGMVTSRAMVFFSPPINLAAAGFGSAGILAMFSVANYGFNVGDGQGRRLGDNFFALICRYIVLSTSHITRHRSMIAAVSAILTVISTIIAVRNLFKPEPNT